MNVSPLVGPDATLRSLAPASYAVVTGRGSPTLYVEEPTLSAIQTLRDAWRAMLRVRRNRLIARDMAGGGWPASTVDGGAA